jgi:hypothetical protein
MRLTPPPQPIFLQPHSTRFFIFNLRRAPELAGARDPSRTTPHLRLQPNQHSTVRGFYFVLIGCSVRMQASSCSMAFNPHGMAAWAEEEGGNVGVWIKQMRISLCTCVCMCVHEYKCVGMHICVRVCARVYMCVHVCMCVNVCTCVYMCAHVCAWYACVH